MTTRIIVGLISLPFIFSAIWFGGIWFALLVIAVALIGGHELFALLTIGGYTPATWLGLCWLAALVVTGGQPQSPFQPLVLTVGLILVLIYALFQKEKPASAWMATSIGAIYLGFMLSQALALRQLPNGQWWVFFGLLMTWVNDTAAYFTGTFLGRIKLWPRLSPKKTWEGTLGGWVAAGLASIVLGHFTPLALSISTCLLLGLAGGMLALCGDLSISMLKRQMGVKDTSHLIPGHGGVLDRLDSILFVMPCIYQIATLWLR